MDWARPRKPGFNSQSHVNLKSYFPKSKKRGCFSNRHHSLFPSLACTILLGFVLSLGKSTGLRSSPAAGVQCLKITPSSCSFLFLSKDSAVTQASTEEHSLERSGTENLKVKQLGKYNFKHWLTELYRKCHLGKNLRSNQLGCADSCQYFSVYLLFLFLSW